MPRRLLTAVQDSAQSTIPCEDCPGGALMAQAADDLEERVTRAEDAAAVLGERVDYLGILLADAISGEWDDLRSLQAS